MRLLGTATGGIRAQQVALDVVGDNMANANTTGFKASQANFAEALATELRPADTTMNGKPVGENINVGAGVLYNSISTDFKQGALTTTHRPLDVAINGQGFFEVTLANGEKAYTRDGSFQVDASGNLCDKNGNLVTLVDDQGNVIPEGNLLNTEGLEIDSNGMVSAVLDGERMSYGQIAIALFPNPEGLQKMGPNLLTSLNSGDPQLYSPGSEGVGSLQTKALEASNVDLPSTMTDMIQVQRAYQMNSRMVSYGDQMWGVANSMRR